MLDHWLWELTAIGSFPIPWVLHGEDVIKAADPNVGTVYCWIHEPLAEFPMWTFLELGYPEAIVVADRGRMVDGEKYRVAEMGNRLVAILADRYALGRAKRSLQERSLLCAWRMRTLVDVRCRSSCIWLAG
jgi:hypothetical protein